MFNFIKILLNKFYDFRAFIIIFVDINKHKQNENKI